MKETILCSFSRSIPSDLQHRFKKREIEVSLRTKSDQSQPSLQQHCLTGLNAIGTGCGLLVSDIHLDTTTPYIDLVENPWRRLKTGPSKRQVSLVGFSSWAARQISHMGSDLAFPKYCRANKCNAYSASAALNKWLNSLTPMACVIHSSRHISRDRLRTIECPVEITDAIGGWSPEGIGQRYAVGFDLKLKSKWMKKINVLLTK